MNSDDLEKKVEELATRVNDRIEDLNRRIEEKLANAKAEEKIQTGVQSRKSGIPFWGIALVLVGVILLGEHLHWFDLDIPFLPAALIVLGSYLILDNRH